MTAFLIEFSKKETTFNCQFFMQIQNLPSEIVFKQLEILTSLRPVIRLKVRRDNQKYWLLYQKCYHVMVDFFLCKHSSANKIMSKSFFLFILRYLIWKRVEDSKIRRLFEFCEEKWFSLFLMRHLRKLVLF